MVTDNQVKYICNTLVGIACIAAMCYTDSVLGWLLLLAILWQE